MRYYRLNPMYWLSRYVGWDLYALKKDVDYTLAIIGDKETGKEASCGVLKARTFPTPPASPESLESRLKGDGK